MKTQTPIVFLLAFLFFGSDLSAQDYRTVKTNSEDFFQPSHYDWNNNEVSIAGLKCDSAHVNANDSVYYPYRTMRVDYNTANFCNVDIAYPICFGTKIKISNSGLQTFYTINNDSLLLDVNTFPGDTQTIYSWPSGDRLLGIHLSTAFQNFANLNDTVKTWNLQVVDNSNLAISSPWNGRHISVSRSNGLVEMIGVRDFPNDTLSLSRVDAHRLKWSEVYPWQPGDQIHSSSHAWGGPPNYVSDYILYNRTILARTVINADSIVFTIERTYHHTRNFPPINLIVTDTIQFGVGNFTHYIHSEMPLQVVDSTHTYELLFDPLVCGKLRMTDHHSNGVFVDTCVHFESFEPLYHDNIYFETAGDYSEEGPHFLNGYMSLGSDLIYYSVGNEICGNPVYVGIKDLQAQAEIRFYPNPASNQLQVVMTTEIMNAPYEICSAAGQKVLSGNLNSAPIDISALSTGMYFISVQPNSVSSPVFYRFVKE